MPCKKDGKLPGCEICHPYNPNICPMYNGGTAARNRSARSLGIRFHAVDDVFSGGVEDPTPQEVQDIVARQIRGSFPRDITKR